MLVPSDHASRDLDTLAEGVVASLVRDNDIASLREGWNHARSCRESLSIDDASRHSKERGNVGLSAHMDILSAIKTWGPTGANTVIAKGMDSFLLKLLIADKVVEVVGSKIDDSAAVGEL